MSAKHWWLTKDGDKSCLAMFEKHYSAYQYADGRRRNLFAGPGEKLVLRTASADAIFVWRKFRDACIDSRTNQPQRGINCSIFRNESSTQSSELIRQADAIADCVWPGERHYTYVSASAVRSSNPGFCFIAAGWTRLNQKTKRHGLIILERK